MKKKIFVVAAIITSSQLLAQKDSIYNLMDEVQFTSNRYPKKQSETGKVITIITRQQLEKSGGRTLGEMLNTVVGATVIGANNNPGTNQTISIRGASSGNILILYDGIPVSDPSVNTNYFDINLLSLDHVERIEILKGGHSTLYGTDAVAGVINIIPRKSKGRKFSLDATVAAGSYNTFRQSLSVTGTVKKLNYGLQYSHQDSEGFSSAFDSIGNNSFDRDAFNSHVLSGRISYNLSPRLTAKLFSGYSHYDSDLDAAAFIDDRDHTVKNRNFQAGVGLTRNGAKATLHLNHAFNYVSRHYLDDSMHKSSPFVDYSRSYFIGRSHFTELYANWKWQGWELTSGLDHNLTGTRQDYFSTGMFGPYDPPQFDADMNQFSAYSSLIYKNKGFNVEFGGRWTNHSEYGNNISYTLNPSLLVNDKLKVFGNLYSAYKVPTLYQLYDAQFGNALLEPEISIISELGMAFTSGNNIFTRMTGFYRNAKDVIIFVVTDPMTFDSEYRNLARQRNYGLELELSYQLGKFRFDANYAFTDGETKAAFDGTGFPLGKDTTYYNLYRIPKHAANVSAGFQVNQKIFFSAAFRVAGEREEFIFGGSPLTMDSYYTIDLYSEYRFYNRFKAFIDFRNITDREYFEIPGYNTKGFNFNLGFTLGL